MTYQVWMRDGYAGLFNADSEEEACAQAIEAAIDSTEGAVMTPEELKLARTVDYAEQL